MAFSALKPEWWSCCLQHKVWLPPLVCLPFRIWPSSFSPSSHLSPNPNFRFWQTVQLWLHLHIVLSSSKLVFFLIPRLISTQNSGLARIISSRKCCYSLSFNHVLCVPISILFIYITTLFTPLFTLLLYFLLNSLSSLFFH